jgi:hypothetical protein
MIFPVANYIGRICKHFLQSPMGKHCFVINSKNVLQEIRQFDQYDSSFRLGYFLVILLLLHGRVIAAEYLQVTILV